MLALHIVGAGRDITHRRTAQHHRRIVEANKIIEIAEAAGKLTWRIGLMVKAKAVFAEMRRQSHPVLHGLCFRLEKIGFRRAARLGRCFIAQHVCILFRSRQNLGTRGTAVNAPGATLAPRT